MENIEDIINELWHNKILVLFHIVNENEIKDVIYNGITKTDKYPYILIKNKFESLLAYLNKEQYVVLIAVPDEVHKNVYQINESFFQEYKNQFDYYDNADCLLDEISGSYSSWDYLSDQIFNYIPSSLVYGVISLDSNNKVNFYKNDKYYDYLDDSEKRSVCEVLRDATAEDIDYDEYLSLIKKVRK